MVGHAHLLVGLADPPAGLPDPPAGLPDPPAGLLDPSAGLADPQWILQRILRILSGSSTNSFVYLLTYYCLPMALIKINELSHVIH